MGAVAASDGLRLSCRLSLLGPPWPFCFLSDDHGTDTGVAELGTWTHFLLLVHVGFKIPRRDRGLDDASTSGIFETETRQHLRAEDLVRSAGRPWRKINCVAIADGRDEGLLG